MKKVWNIILCMLVMMLVSGCINEKIVYAGEESNEIVTDTQKVVKEYIYLTEDAPDNMMSILNQRSALNEYDIQTYEFSQTFHTTWLGATIDLITITVEGEVYLYEDGKVHLYSMTITAQSHVLGSVDIGNINIVNTDGAWSAGEVMIYLDSLLHGEHSYGCRVVVTAGFSGEPRGISATMAELL